WFDNLAAQGQIEMDWQETFWAQGFGKVSDRFGVPWMINVVKHEVTRGRDGSAHPHFHTLMMVPPSMLSGRDYVKQYRWVELWRD
ncbi:protein rep, partial [Salmonella enterica subsp. enterica serovar Kentucky]|nr:protein rep [Salmonella enterica subsp. enterica serovar Kentucky]